MRRWFDRFRRLPSEEEFAEEVRSHLAHVIDEQVERGVEPQEARYAAIRKFGNVTRHVERFREVSPWFWLDTFSQDLRYSWRSITRSKPFFLTSVVSLALGMGGSTALYSVLDATVLRPFTYAQSKRLGVFVSANAQRTPAPVTSTDVAEYAALSDVFQDVAGIVGGSSLLDDSDEPTGTSSVTCNFFGVVRVTAALGRTLIPTDCDPSTPRVIVLSHELWTSQFGKNTHVIGRTLKLKSFLGLSTRREEETVTIIGIMPPHVSFWGEEAWLPSKIHDDSQIFYVLARLKPEVTFEQAGARVATVAKRLARPDVPKGVLTPSGVQSLRDYTVGGYQMTIYALLAGAASVLLIGCINVAMLLFARKTAAETELGVRMCLGASTGRLIRQLGAESLLLATCGGIVGTAFAIAALPWLSACLITAGVAPQADIRLNAAAFLVTAVLVVLAAFSFAIALAMHAIRTDPVRTVVGGSRTATPRRGRGWRAFVVATQLALALPVVCVSFALVGSFLELRGAVAAYEPDHLLLVMPRGLGLQNDRYRNLNERERLWQRLDAAIQAVPGVRSTAITAPLALNRTAGATVEPLGSAEPARWQVQLRCASPDFFSTMNVALVRGRTFESTGALARQPVAVVSRSFARIHFGDVDPIGRQLRVKKATGTCPAEAAPLEIIGIVENTQLPDVDTGNPESPPTLYVSTELVTPRAAQFLVRTAVPAASLRRDVQRAIASVDPELVGRARTLREDAEGAWMPWPRLLVPAGLSAAGAGLLLVLVGVFGVLSYSLAQLTRELGIRIALGASPSAVAGQVFGRGFAWVTLGAAIGCLATVVLLKVARSRIWGLAPLDVYLVAAVAAFVVVTAGIACWLPARRAMRIDPAMVLRAE